jgi:hypothetical protein
MAIQTHESAALQAVAAARDNDRQLKLWRTLTAAQLLQGNDVPDDVPEPDVTRTTTVSPTTLDAEAPPAVTDILPPPSFLVSSSKVVSSSQQ